MARSNAKRNRENAETFAAKLRDDVGAGSGWIIVSSKDSAWYGFYADAEQARTRIGCRDSHGDKISGTVIEV